jgi:hypothetical protein
MRRVGLGGTGRDRGAAAVEFALVLPLLLLLVFGIIDFGRALNAQVTLTQAAREGARLVALNQPNVVSRTQAAATGLSGVNVTVVTGCPPPPGGPPPPPPPPGGPPPPGTDAVVQVSYTFSFVTPVGAIAGIIGGSGFGSPITLTAKGVMPCES